jgi:hypothetical protein
MYLNLHYAQESRADQHDAKLGLHSRYYLLPKKPYLLIRYLSRKHVGKPLALAKSEHLYRSLVERIVVLVTLVLHSYHDTFSASHKFKPSWGAALMPYAYKTLLKRRFRRGTASLKLS